jgi:hypothetical protein
MPDQPTFRPVYKALHRPLTICGIDRRLSFFALLSGAANCRVCKGLDGNPAIQGLRRARNRIDRVFAHDEVAARVTEAPDHLATLAPQVFQHNG